ncbi:MAG: hypothetical protein AVDCRST_MAG61-1237, partial [uncultured Friedmanniella sp.]
WFLHPRHHPARQALPPGASGRLARAGDPACRRARPGDFAGQRVPAGRLRLRSAGPAPGRLGNGPLRRRAIGPAQGFVAAPGPSTAGAVDPTGNL